MKQLLIIATMLVATAAQAVPAIPITTWTASWTDAHGVARASTVNANNEVYVGNKASFTLSGTTSDAAWTTIRASLPAIWGKFGCSGSYQQGTCWQPFGQSNFFVDIESLSTGVRLYKSLSAADVSDINFMLGGHNMDGTWNVVYSTDFKVYGQPTTTELGRIFTYARSMVQDLGTEIRTITIDGAGAEAGEYQYTINPTGTLAVGINANDGKIWWYDGEFHIYADWWTTLAEAQAAGY